MHTTCLLSSGESVSLLGLELQMAESHPVDAGNQTWGLRKSNKGS